MWPEWSPWTWWGLALLGIPMYFAPNIWASRHSIVRVFSGSVGFMVVVQAVLSLTAVGLVIGVIYYAFFIYERPKWVWIHRTFSATEQEQVKAECRMEAAREVGTKWWSQYQGYIADCLIAKGFSLEPADDAH